MYLNVDLSEQDVGFAQANILLRLIRRLNDDNYSKGINVMERGICASSSKRFYLFDFCEK